MARVRFPFCLEVVIYVAAVAVASSHGAHAHSVPAKLGPTDPHYMMLVSSGCSGSSWVWSTIVHVIEAHWRRNQSSVLPVLLGPVRCVSACNRPVLASWLNRARAAALPAQSSRPPPAHVWHMALVIVTVITAVPWNARPARTLLLVHACCEGAPVYVHSKMCC